MFLERCLLIRTYELIFGKPITINNINSFDSVINDTQQNAYRVTDLHIEFDISKDNTHKSNNGSITIFNLSDDVVNYINQNANQKLAVLLKAGYNGENQIIFQGEVSFFEDNWEGDLNTRQTKLTLKDGETALLTATTNRSYKTGTLLNTVLADLISDLNLPQGRVIKYGSSDTLKFSKSFHGTASQNLNNLASATGRTFSVQDGSVYYTVQGKALKQTVLEISEESGMLGIPTVRTMSAKQLYELEQKKDKTKKEAIKQKIQNKEDTGLVVQCLLNGAIIPETTVYLNSRYLKGFYKVVEVNHKGAYEGDNWVTEMKLAEVNGKLITETYSNDSSQ